MTAAQRTASVPSVRGDAMLLTHGRRGSMQDELLVSAAVLLDGMLGGHIVVAGRLRRRIVAGPELPGAPDATAELRSRAVAAGPDSVSGWLDRAGRFAHAAATAELDASGATIPLQLSRTPRVFRHDTLWVVPEAESAARQRLLAALSGDGSPPATALAATLHAAGLLTEVAGARDVRRLPALEPAARAVLSAVRRRAAYVPSLTSGGWRASHPR